MSSFFQRVGSLFVRRSEGLLRAPEGLETIDPLSLSLASTPLSVGTTPGTEGSLLSQPPLDQLGYFAEVISPDSPIFQEIRLLQEERFARASARGHSTYLETVDIDPQHTIPLAVRRSDTGLLVGAALLELPSATNIEFMVQFRPGSPSAARIEEGTFAEIRGLALRTGLTWNESLDILDVLGNALVQTAKQYNIAWLWTLPRQSIMSLMLAEIPGLLPAYRFTPSTDVLGWREESVQLQKMRKLRLKALPISPDTLPIIYQISPTLLAEDLAQRIALLEQRHQTPDLPQLLQAAMLRAARQVHSQIDLLNRQKKDKKDRREASMKSFGPKPSKGNPSSSASEPDSPGTGTTQMITEQERPSRDGHEKGFLPGAAAEVKAGYLRQFVEQGGAAATTYKALSYNLLQIEPGMQVLDVGCGVGLDLLPLADRVGAEGLVVGVDHDAALVLKAKEASAGHTNVRAVVGEAEVLPFAHRSFDGVRADRVLQHISQPETVLAEMWRVLRPGGVLTLVEPDWKMVGLFPGSSAGGDDDHTWSRVLTYTQREIIHPLVGRQLSHLLRQPGANMWESVQIRVEAFALTTWPSANAVLRLSEMAQRLAQEEPTLADEVSAWLQEIQAADQRGAFLASTQLFYACARKVASNG